MLGSIGKFLKDRRGAFAMQFALLVVPLTVCTGLAVDGGRAFLARYELNAALDAAALAVGSTIAQDADLDAIAQTFVDANFKSDHVGGITLDLTPGDDIIRLKGTVTINTYFMPLVGQPSVTVSAETEVARGGGNVEVALALDITGSMAGSKITTLKQAAKDLIDEVVHDSQSPFFSKVAIAPWGTNFHVGSYAAALRGPVTGPAAITGAHWRNGTAKTISAGSWRNGAAKTISTASWRNGSAVTISAIARVTTPSTRIRVTTSANHGYITGEFVRIAGANGSFTGLNNNIYYVEVSSTTRFYLKDVANTAYIAPPTGTITNATAGSSQRCFSGTCEVGVTTSAAHGLSNGDFVHITGVGTMTAINNTATGTWAITGASGSVFVLPGTVGPGSASYNTDGTGGTASECFTSTCQYQVTTSTNHGFADNDYIYITGATIGSGTSINNSTGSTWSITDVTANTFLLPGTGTSYGIWSSGGTAAECYTATCEVKVTAAGHGLAASDYVQITSVGGFTGVNNTWQVASVASNDFYLPGWGPSLSNSSSAYSANTGQAQCLAQGCQKYRFTAADGSIQVKTISNCVTERVGGQAATDAAPSVAFLGRDYAGSGSLVGCNTGNNLVPLTSDKAALKTAIDNMVVYGSTAGQIGSAWGWYLVSPDWGYLWPAVTNRPLAYGTDDLNKVVVLMTDGEFNTAHCNGVTTENYATGSVADTDLIDSSVCTAAKSPFDQAQDICTAMKAKNIIVYTVGFQVGTAPGAAGFLTACATDPNHAYLADDATALKAAFKSIAKAISRLRLSK